jgi:hypothetical protein
MIITIYAIEVPSEFGASSWVRTTNGRYGGMGNVPTLFATTEDANRVLLQYVTLCKNDGKLPSFLRVVKREVGA